MKKLHHKTISHLFSRMDDIRGHKDNISATEKIPKKSWCRVSRECIKLPTFTKYQNTQKNHLETKINARNNKRQNLSIKTAAAWRIFLPSLNMSRIFAIFLFR
jgi:hypothetical protein